jgi:glycosyltransferase involved in cell wall biosynthesis
MPCKDQKDRFLVAAIDSVLRQTSPHWRLLVIVDPDTPEAVRARVASFADGRIHLLVSSGGGIGVNLNAGMRAADTDFVCILLSDDTLARGAVATVRRCLRKHPEVDFFYSSRRYIDADGRPQGPIMRSVAQFTLEDFATRGSRVKHLLCWRREKGLEVGGFDQRFSDHGCDDFDFPWVMAEAGARFQAIRECLYYHRRHQEFFRLTTHIPVARQVEITTAMFRKHRVSEPVLSRYLRRALSRYLLADATASYRDGKPPPLALSCCGEFTPERLGDFLRAGYKQRHFFPHRIYYLPKGGPDGLKLAFRMCGVRDPARLYELVLFASPAVTDQFPNGLFFDDDIIWHQQQFGRKGQVASANVALDGQRMFGMVYISDLVQRISRQRQHKTRVENVFKGWSRLLINALLVFAIEHGVQSFSSATAALALRNTDPRRHPDGRLFTRVYDNHLREVLDADLQGDWWRIDVPQNRHRAIHPERRRELVDTGKTICICHDIERGLGHTQSDPDFARSVDGPARQALTEMLDVEQREGIRCTYHILGVVFDEVRGPVAARGHAVGFHSYDHHIGPAATAPVPGAGGGLESYQLQKCRTLDYRIKGYRPPQSRLTADISDAHLSFYNFEWLASSQSSLQCSIPHVENGIVKIPIHLDDYDLYTGKQTFEEWAARAVELVRQNDFTALSLHDCYAGFWLKEYAGFLRSLRGLGMFRTLDEVAAHAFLHSSL